MRTLVVGGLLTLTFGLSTLNAQEPAPASSDYHPVEIGARFMPTFSSFDLRNPENGVIQGEFTLGYGWGGLLALNFNNNVGMQIEGIYQTMSQKYRQNDLDHTVKLSYMNFPVLLALNTGKDSPVNLNVVVGPQFGLNVGSKLETSSGGGVDTVNAILAVKTGDLGVAYGAGLEFGLGASRNWHLDLGFRGVYGLIDISDKSQSTTTNDYYILDRAHVKSYAGYVGLSYAF